MTADIKDFHLGTPLPTKEYMRISLKHIPREAQERHNIAAFANDGYVMMKISKAGTGPSEAAPCLARLPRSCVNTLPLRPRPPARHVYPGSRRFGIKYKTTDAAQHLLDTLRKLYTI